MTLATTAVVSAVLLGLAVVAGTVMAALGVTEPTWFPYLVTFLLGHAAASGAIAGGLGSSTPGAGPPASPTAGGAAGPAIPAPPAAAGVGPALGGS